MKKKYYYIIGTIFAFLVCSFLVKADVIDVALLNDSDKDGLTNEEERIYGTDPDNDDTDGDGYGDGTEIESGYNPLIAAPGDRIIKDKDKRDKTLTSEFSEKIETFVSDRQGQKITIDDINEFINEDLQNELTKPLKLSDLPNVNEEDLNLYEVDCSDNEECESKKKNEVNDYINNVIYIILNNIPYDVKNEEDIKEFWELLDSKANTLTTESADFEFFKSVNVKLGIVIDELYELPVPDQAGEVHIKFIKILKGFNTLGDEFDENDPLSLFLILINERSLEKIFMDFMSGDVNDLLQKNNIKLTD